MKTDWRTTDKAEAIREQMRESARKRWPSKLRKYGITEEIYRNEIANGNKWCTGHKRFEARTEFSHDDKPWPCRGFIRTNSRAFYHALSVEKRREIYQGSKHLETPERRRKRTLWHDFKLTVDAYAEMLSKQNGVCAICCREPKGKRLAVDHDHACCKGKYSCGKCVRGLLCTGCNRKVGLIEYNPELFAKANEYLRLHSKET